MNIFAIKQGYIVKSVLFISFLCILSLSLIGGCSDGGGQKDSQVLTENNFAQDSSLRAELDQGVIATLLESPESEEAVNDTGTLGVDEIPVTFIERTEQTFCWEDDNADAMHFMELRDGEGNIILTLEVNGDCVTELIEAGDYVIYIYHDESGGDALAIFLIPDPEELEQTREIERMIDKISLAAANIVKAIQMSITKDARAQDVIENERILFRTNSCVECDLEGGLMGSWRLSGAALSGANLRRASLFETILIDADLSGADLSNARMNGADLTGADLSGAIMEVTILDDAVLIGADMSGATMFRAFFIGADLTDADLRGAILRQSFFRGATWCDGICRCLQDSIDTCIGCASIDICTGP